MLELGEMQRQLSCKAERDPIHRFGNLYSLLYDKEWLRVAHDSVKRNAGSVTAGCDGINMDIFDQHLERNLEELAEQLATKTFTPYPVRRVYIPKSAHKWRPLGIPSIRDRIVQEALRMVLEPIYEGDFSQHSFGFRPNRCTMDAISCLHWSSQERKKYFWAIEGDISAYFDTVKHRKLLKILKKRIADSDLLHLIWRFLKAGVMEKKLFRATTMGVPQGGIASPLLANVYLNELDQYIYKRYTSLSEHDKRKRRRRREANAVYVRYADDFVVLSNGTKGQVKELKEELQQFLNQELQIELSEEKTKITHLNEGFKFLGFQIKRKMGQRGISTKVMIPHEAVRHIKEKIAQTTDPTTHLKSLNTEIMALNRIIGGWCRYYRHTARAATVFDGIRHYTFWRLSHWIGRKYQIPMTTVMRTYRKGNTLGTDDVTLLEATSISTFRYRKSYLKPNPYTMCKAEHIVREELPATTHWMGYERRPGMADLRPAILERDKYTCQWCERRCAPSELHVDHIRPVRRFKRPIDANVPGNLWTLCIRCHAKKTKADRQGESRMP